MLFHFPRHKTHHYPAAAVEEREHLVLKKPDACQLEVDLLRQLSTTNSSSTTSTEKPLRHLEIASNGNLTAGNLSASQREYIRPLLSILNKEQQPSRNIPGQLDYVSHLPALEKHESILPLLNASTERKTNGELELGLF